MEIFILLLLFILGFFLITLAGYHLFSRLTSNYIGKKHRQMEHIINTGRVPDEWEKTMEGKNSSKQIKYFLQELEKLIEYSKSSNLLEDEKTQKFLVEKLESTYEEWKGKAGEANWPDNK